MLSEVSGDETAGEHDEVQGGAPSSGGAPPRHDEAAALRRDSVRAPRQDWQAGAVASIADEVWR